jgi:hypothetical protein
MGELSGVLPVADWNEFRDFLKGQSAWPLCPRRPTRLDRRRRGPADLLPLGTGKEALAATRTDGGQNTLSRNPSLGQVLSGHFETQAAIEGPQEAVDATLAETTVSACSSEGNEERPLRDSNRGWRIGTPLPDRHKDKPRKEVAKTTQEALACKIKIDLDLGRLIDAWPDLAANVKRMILAALEANG